MDGSVIYVRIWTRYGGVWRYSDYIYIAHPPDNVTITFSNAGSNGAAYTLYAEANFHVNVRTGSWTFNTNDGNPSPFVQFMTPAGTTASGELIVVPPVTLFHFNSVDIYSSTTDVSFEISATRPGGSAFVFTGTVSNPMGTFVRVTNPYSAITLDQLFIKLTGTSGCCDNPVGLDNIKISY